MTPSITPAELAIRLLTLRGYETSEQQADFLHPKYADMHDPFLMHDMHRAVVRILSAIQNNEKICIYSDYDADGIPGNVILGEFFKKIGYTNFTRYIPHRHDEGYGVHAAALDGIAADGVTLVITVDVGITAVDEIAHGTNLGLDIIITDHHEPLEIIPDAYAVVNPKLGDYPDRMLCGSGVAFKLVQAMIVAAAKHRDILSAELGYALDSPRCEYIESLAAAAFGWEKWLLDLAGIATLSDMVPLVNENRIIAYFGMKVLEKNMRPGLRALFQISGIDLRHLTETDIVFSITPRLNAASRMAHPIDALKLLATDNTTEASQLAQHVTALNDTRKKIVKTVMDRVHERITVLHDQGIKRNILVIGDRSWSPGILGLIAGKVVDTYHVTTFVWGGDGEQVKGSVRGAGNVSVVKLMESATHALTQFGGHTDAGGFTALHETIHELEDVLNDLFPDVKYDDEDCRTPDVMADMELNLSDVTIAHYKQLRTLAPFGMGNPEPVFAFRNVTVQSVKQFGKTGEHIEIIVMQNNMTVRAVAWYRDATCYTRGIAVGDTVTLLAKFEYSMFRGKGELRLQIVDVRD